MTTAALLLFTKPAIPGRVKTRLIGALTAVEAARLHRAFLDDLIERFAGGPAELRVYWSLEPGEPVPLHPPGGRRQAGEDLGERLVRAIEESGDAERVAVVGSDHPELPAERVTEALEALDRGADVVFGPAADGGYYLVALRPAALRREIFEGVPWSSARVLEVSLARCAEAGLSVALLETGHDVDLAEDLAPLAARLARLPELAPRTWRELENRFPESRREEAG